MMGRLVVLLPPYLIWGLSSGLEDQDANHMLIKLKKESQGFRDKIVRLCLYEE